MPVRRPTQRAARFIKFIARHLAGTGYEAEVLLLWPAGQLSPDAGANLERFEGEVREVAAGELPW